MYSFLQCIARVIFIRPVVQTDDIHTPHLLLNNGYIGTVNSGKKKRIQFCVLLYFLQVVLSFLESLKELYQT